MQQSARTIGVYIGTGRYLTLEELCPFPERGTLFNHLIREGSKRNIKFFFGDEADSCRLDAEIHFEFQFRNTSRNSYLIQFETFNVNPKNLLIGTPLSRKYRAIFGWEKFGPKVQGVQYIYSEIPYNRYPIKNFDIKGSRELRFSMIATNRNLNIPTVGGLNGYNLRQKVIKHFKNEIPCSFSLYGREWDLAFALPVFQKIQRKLGGIESRFEFYKGEVVSKFDVLLKSDFNFCFENKLHVEGYYTEKIFDALICGAIPIYCGTKTVDAIVPKDCYIDLRDYASLQELVTHCQSLSIFEIENYRRRIRDFVTRFDWSKLSEVAYVNRLLDYIEKDGFGCADNL